MNYRAMTIPPSLAPLGERGVRARFVDYGDATMEESAFLEVRLDGRRDPILVLDVDDLAGAKNELKNLELATVLEAAGR